MTFSESASVSRLVLSNSCNPMDCSPPGSSVHGILQARILKWVGIPFSRGSSWPRDQTRVSCIAGRFFTIWVTREARREGLQMSLYLRRLHYLPCLYCFAQFFFFFFFFFTKFTTSWCYITCLFFLVYQLVLPSAEQNLWKPVVLFTTVFLGPRPNRSQSRCQRPSAERSKCRADIRKQY